MIFLYQSEGIFFKTTIILYKVKKITYDVYFSTKSILNNEIKINIYF